MSADLIVGSITFGHTPGPLTVEHLYNELLFAVGNKYPGETRHQTALRYIRQAESHSIHDSPASKT